MTTRRTAKYLRRLRAVTTRRTAKYLRRLRAVTTRRTAKYLRRLRAVTTRRTAKYLRRAVRRVVAGGRARYVTHSPAAPILPAAGFFPPRSRTYTRRLRVPEV